MFGPSAGLSSARCSFLGLISSMSSMIWIGPRVTMTMGEDLPALRLAHAVEAPASRIAILFQLQFADVVLLTQRLWAVVDFIQFSLTLCSFFAVLGVIKMRITHPGLARPYRAWGYPLTPLIFLTMTLFVMYYLVVQSAAAVARRPCHDAGRPCDLLYVSPPLESSRSGPLPLTPVPLKVDALDRA